ncbi:MAG: endolytic transglycosylase MltG [Elusimicrobia bacterium]|nr:endolytic transglycosylase MltG [Elusimicrobiota bacterium]
MRTGLALIVLFPLLWVAVPRPVRVEVNLPEGVSAKDVCLILHGKGIILRKSFFLKAAVITGSDTALKYGLYKFYRNEPVLSVLGKLKNGKAVLIKVTIPEGWRSDEIAEALNEAGVVGKTEFLNYVVEKKLEGRLYPETYFFTSGMPVEKVCDAFLKQFNSVFFTDKIRGKAAKAGLSPQQALILASIIEKEAKTPREKFLISGIFHNRLKKRWRLESCATVRYALRKWKRPLSIEDTFAKSPFNTYRHWGLPPAPICNPGRIALEAAVEPQKTEMMFFVASSSGTHRFSKYFDQHIKKKFIEKRKK